AARNSSTPTSPARTSSSSWRRWARRSAAGSSARCWATSGCGSRRSARGSAATSCATRRKGCAPGCPIRTRCARSARPRSGAARRPSRPCARRRRRRARRRSARWSWRRAGRRCRRRATRTASSRTRSASRVRSWRPRSGMRRAPARISRRPSRRTPSWRGRGGSSQRCPPWCRRARLTERRRALVDSEQVLLGELKEGERRLAAVEQAPALAEQYARELEEAKRELVAAEQEVGEQLADWVQKKEEVRTRLETYRKRGQELKEQMRMLKQAGPEGTCPTCERPLGVEFERVFARLRDEWEALVQDGKWLRQREKQLTGKPDDLAQAESRRAAVRAAVEEKARRLARCQQAVQELDTLRADRHQREERLEKLRAELAALPAEYDRERHRQAEARLRELRELERRASRLEPAAEARPQRERELAAAEARIESVRARLAETEKRRAELAFQEDAYRELAALVERAATEQREAELRVVELRGVLQGAEQALEAAQRAESEYQTRREALTALEAELRHHNELD